MTSIPECWKLRLQNLVKAQDKLSHFRLFVMSDDGKSLILR